jgi:hypothetical protein
VPSSYKFAPIFLIRMAGVPFETVEQLATAGTSAQAREVIIRYDKLAKAIASAEQLLNTWRGKLSANEFRTWRKALRSGRTLAGAVQFPVEISLCEKRRSEVAAAVDELGHLLPKELINTREALLNIARTVLPRYLIFTERTLRDRLTKQSSSELLVNRNKDARAHERHLLLYVQRICAKNDSLSEFGPEGWGWLNGEIKGVSFSPKPGIASRETFLERWVAHGAAAALNADPHVRMELCPRLHPSGRVESSSFIFAQDNKSVPLNPNLLSILERIDGETPAHALGVEPQILKDLAREKIIQWAVEVPALDPHAFHTLVADVASWRENSTSTRWLDLLRPIAGLPKKFAAKNETILRAEIMDHARGLLSDLGVRPGEASRFLYSASNPIGEECFRECNFRISEQLITEVANDAAPWIDLWRDSYAFVANRVASGLRDLLAKARPHNGTMPLPGFLRHCESLKMSLTGPGLVGLAHIGFQEVKAAFCDRLKPHGDKAEYQLTTEDCYFIRDNFAYDKFDEYTYPSADLQISAESIDAVTAGNYRWILAELHPPVALLHHGFYWSCPDKAALRAGLISTVFGRPNFHFGFFAADFTATTTVCLPEALPDLTHFVAPERARRSWHVVSPAETEVYIEENTGDVCLRKIRTHEHLGSFARAWLIPLGFHPFQFGMAPHIPRLLCGKVVVQRRSWTISQEEWPPGDYTGISRDLVLAIERLRAEKDWPRYVYIRPTEQALRRSGAEGRDKDTKPVFIDLESYLFLEIFCRWLTKSGELEVTEMLPDPDHLLWREPDGRRTFELRTLIVPAK